MQILAVLIFLFQLEYAGMAGVVIVIWLTVVVVAQSIGHGLPALGNGELKKSGFSSLGQLNFSFQE